MEGRLQREPITFTLRSPCHRGSDQTPLPSPLVVAAATAACQILQSEGRKGSDHGPPTLVCHCSRKAPHSVAVSILRETTASDSRLRKVTKYQTPLLVTSELLTPPPLPQTVQHRKVRFLAWYLGQILLLGKLWVTHTCHRHHAGFDPTALSSCLSSDLRAAEGLRGHVAPGDRAGQFQGSESDPPVLNRDLKASLLVSTPQAQACGKRATHSNV